MSFYRSLTKAEDEAARAVARAFCDGEGITDEFPVRRQIEGMVVAAHAGLPPRKKFEVRWFGNKQLMWVDGWHDGSDENLIGRFVTLG